MIPLTLQNVWSIVWPQVVGTVLVLGGLVWYLVWLAA